MSVSKKYHRSEIRDRLHAALHRVGLHSSMAARYPEFRNPIDLRNGRAPMGPIPEMDVSDADLPELVAAFDSRQILHVGYGDVLTAVDGAGQRHFDVALREVLPGNAELYATVLAEHLGRHVAPFAVTG